MTSTVLSIIGSGSSAFVGIIAVGELLHWREKKTYPSPVFRRLTENFDKTDAGLKKRFSSSPSILSILIFIAGSIAAGYVAITSDKSASKFGSLFACFSIQNIKKMCNS
jgi:hypothetical protein